MGDTRVLFDDILEDKIKIEPVNKEKIKQVKQEWNRVSKPIDSFGNFEIFIPKSLPFKALMHLIYIIQGLLCVVETTALLKKG